jgi:ABC-type multidrug transport system permease subunit/Skp family chaperone for outer membrane proteins
MLRAILLTIGKEFRLLWRDRVGLFMLLVAPIAVISVAGFSLSNLYGADPSGQTAYLLPVVDEDHDQVAKAVIEALGHEHAVEMQLVPSRALAEELVRDRNQAGVALIIPAGTTHALEQGKDPELILFTDPVKYLEIINVELRVSELCRRIGAQAQADARERLTRAQQELRDGVQRLNATLEKLRTEAESRQHQAELERKQAEAAIRRQVSLVQTETETRLNQELDRIGKEISGQAEKQSELLDSARRYLSQLQTTRTQFESWFAELKKLAGSRASQIPAPPSFPSPPPELQNAALAQISPETIRARLRNQISLPRVEISVPAARPMPPLPQISSIHLDHQGDQPALPGSLGIREQNLTGASTRINTFDQNVPGFGVTFVLIGMLIGVSLGLIDEREWGTLQRLRAAAAPIAATLTGKIISRFIAGVVQLLILFVIGWLAFGISLGRQPLALLMPCAAIAFAGASFGLLVSVVARTRDAVLPVGTVVIMTMAAVGGCWWPIDLEPRWMRTVALALPTTWTMQAFNDLMIRHLGSLSAVRPAAITAGFGLLYLAGGLAALRGRLE